VKRIDFVTGSGKLVKKSNETNDPTIINMIETESIFSFNVKSRQSRQSRHIRR
jgi:hypothetical protein